MRFQLVLSIRRDSAQVAAQRRGIRRRRVYDRRRRGGFRNRGRSIGRYCCGCSGRRGLRLRLEGHPDPEATRRVHLVVLILALRLF